MMLESVLPYDIDQYEGTPFPYKPTVYNHEVQWMNDQQVIVDLTEEEELRPEAYIGKKAITEGASYGQLVWRYEQLLVGSMTLLGASKQRIQQALDWLRNTDFYSAPASTKYHGASPAGLLLHSLDVYNATINLLECSAFAEVNPAEATFVALAHDWCKIGIYESYQKNVKNEETGQWEKELAYRTEQKSIPLGHGVTSMFYADRFVSLSQQAALAIRWHMCEYRVCDQEMNELHLANETYPLVQLLQFADRLSITKYFNH